MKIKNNQIWNQVKTIVFITVVIVVFFMIIAEIASSGIREEATVLPTKWSVSKYTSDGRSEHLTSSEMTDVNFDKYDKGFKIVANTKIPEGGIDGITLQMCLRRAAYDVQIVGGRRYSYAVERYLKNESIGNGYHFIHIPQEDCGKKIILRIYFNENDSYENIKQICFFDGNNVKDSLASKNFLFIMLCSFLIVFGAIIGTIGVVLFIKAGYLQFCYIGLFSFLIGLYVLSSRFLIQVFSSNLLTNTFLEYVSFFLLPVPVTLFSNEIVSKKRKKYKRFLKIYALVDIVVTIAVLIGYRFYNFHFNRISSYYRVYMAVALIAMLIAQAKSKVTSKADKLRVSGFWVLIITNSIALFSFVFLKDVGHASDISIYLMPIGNIYLILALLYSYIIDYFASYKDDVEKNMLLKMAYTDQMTGLYNRAKSTEEFTALDERKDTYCIVWFDLNYLKKTNDVYGHEQGDMLIIEFARILKKAFGRIGTVCRIGGDEFCVIIRKSMNDKNIKKCFKNMHALIDDENSGENLYFMETSYGIAGSEEFDEPATDEVCSMADKRMYKMKVAMKAQRTD